MKKIILMFIGLFILIGCSNKKAFEKIEYTNNVSIDAVKSDMSDYVLLKDSDHVYLDLSTENAIKLFEEKGSAVVYIGYVNCPWCNRAVPVLNEIAKESGINVYYLDVAKEENRTQLDTLINTYLKDSLDNGELFVPFVIGIKNGEIVSSQVALVSSYKDYSKDMTKTQISEMKEIYYNIFSSIK
ncbi:MAG: hypothetical protein MR601_05395 [Erysipelotrichaceae bacterium]|nr:hypothetical protein [Erysipelotrichaceae bacterium]